mmetsp:Transcript_11056/g.32032  ORF Transcript_11056/g.32032 Transcript_11056/m.32032 type:complete len:750 (-) Transcript_11056:425-2674(-)
MSHTSVVPMDCENADVPEKHKGNYFDAISDSAQENRATKDPAILLARKNRKKLKKLKKRVILVQIGSERSGLLTRSEYDEYLDLMKDDGNDDSEGNNPASATPSCSSPTESSVPLVASSINLRTKYKGIETVEGVTHRDLLGWLLQQKFDPSSSSSSSSSSSTNSKKRRRDENGDEDEDGGVSGPKAVAVSIPHWASIHNPGACEQVAVLEIDLPDDNIETYKEFLKGCRSKSETKGSANNTDSTSASESNGSRPGFPNSQVGIVTKWFQGYIPKSMSDTLLYFSNAKKEQKNKKGEDESVVPSKKQFIERLEAMLLSDEELSEQGYPIPLPSSVPQDVAGATPDNDNDVSLANDNKLKSPGTISSETTKDYLESFGVRVEEQNEEDKSPYVRTPHNKTKDEDRPVRVFGLDCEMVLTTLGSELARITLLQFDEFVGPRSSSKTTVLLDCLVRPENRVVDYLTKHSGITPEMLGPISITLKQVQCTLANFLTPKDILIGHSLENDLRAMHYIHPRVVDTSMIFRPADRNKRFKFSLRHLSNTLLKKQIQTGSHCSEEDAQTTLDLALLKALKGDDLKVPGYGDNQRQSLLQQKFVQDSVAAFIGPSSWLETHVTKYPTGVHALSYDSPNDVKKAMLAWMTNKRKAHLIWSKIELRNRSEPNAGSETVIERFKSFVSDMIEKMPPTCVLMVAIQGGLQKTRETFKRRGACRDPRSTVIWSDDDEAAWKERLNSTRSGYVHWFSASTIRKS